MFLSAHVVLLAALLPGPVNALFEGGESNFWDELANNLATDLAPIISLFGEQVTKQFLTESTTFLDYIVFAIAPLGILTAIVSVIRVSGSPFLKSLIGRSRESHGLAEMELCSSTSYDVSEMWSNGGICRVFGQPKMLEFMFDADAPASEFYPKYKKEGDGTERLVEATCGIRLVSDVLSSLATGLAQETINSKRDISHGWEEIPSHDIIWGSARTHNPRKLKLSLMVRRMAHRLAPSRLLRPKGSLSRQSSGDLEHSFHQDDKDDDFSSDTATHTTTQGDAKRRVRDHDEEMSFAPFPNLALNLGSQGSSKSIKGLWISAIFGIALQISSFVFATWATWYHSAFYEDGPNGSVTPSFSLMVIGNFLLTLGMAASAKVIDLHSNERRFVWSGPCTGYEICWLQPGGQRIGDQQFNAFAYTDRKKEYTTSWKVQRDQQPHRSLVWFAIGASFLGWIGQFVGLRGIHGSIALYQLACTLLMSAIRAIARRNGFNVDMNHLADSKRAVEGHELDWQALTLGKSRVSSKAVVKPRKGDKTFGPSWSIVGSDPLPKQLRCLESRIFSVHVRESRLRDDKIVTLSTAESKIDEQYLDQMIARITKSIESSSQGDDWGLLRETFRTPGADGSQSSQSQPPSTGSRAMRMRSRLAKLTKGSSQPQNCEWDTEVRRVAKQLRSVIEQAANYMTSDAAENTWVSNGTFYHAWVWGASCLHIDLEMPAQYEEHALCLHMRYVTDRWVIDQDILEAILGLWLWTTKQNPQDSDSNSAEESSTPSNEKTKSHLKAVVFETVEEKEYDLLAKSWLSQVRGLQTDRLLDGRSTNLSVPTAAFRPADSTNTNSQAGQSKYSRLSCRADSSLLQLMAQDIFTVFIDKTSVLMEYLEDIRVRGLGTTLYVSRSRGLVSPHIDRLVDILVSSKLATKEEAFMSIVPSMFAQGKLLKGDALSRDLLYHAHTQRRHGKYKDAAQTLGMLDLLHDQKTNTLTLTAHGLLHRSKAREMMERRSAISNSEFQDEITLMMMLYSSSMDSSVDRTMLVAYQRALRWVFCSLKQVNFHYFGALGFDRVGFLQYARESKVEIDQTRLEQLMLDSIQTKQEAFEMGLTLDDRFNIGSLDVAGRRYLLRWAIEWSILGLVEDIWKSERLNQVKESAFSDGLHNVFWAVINPRKQDGARDILQFLLKVVQIFLHSGNSDEWPGVVAAWASSPNKDYVEASYRRFRNALSAAAGTPGNLEVVQFIIEQNPHCLWKLRTSGNRSNAFAAAIGSGSTEVVEYLVGALNSEDKEAALEWYEVDAEEREDIYFLGNEKDAGRFGTALIAAAYIGRRDCVEILLRAGIDVNRQAKFGDFKTALDAAKATIIDEEQLGEDNPFIPDKEGIVQLLLEHGAI